MDLGYSFRESAITMEFGEMAYSGRAPLYLPQLYCPEADGLTYVLDPEPPNWIAAEEAGRLRL